MRTSEELNRAEKDERLQREAKGNASTLDGRALLFVEVGAGCVAVRSEGAQCLFLFCVRVHCTILGLDGTCVRHDGCDGAAHATVYVVGGGRVVDVCHHMLPHVTPRNSACSQTSAAGAAARWLGTHCLT
jgi:hypothetical protein